MKVYLNLQTAALLLYYIAYSHFHLIYPPPPPAPNILLKTFLPKAANRLVISLFIVQDSAPTVSPILH
jgi:hypothetical protein